MQISENEIKTLYNAAKSVFSNPEQKKLIIDSVIKDGKINKDSASMYISAFIQMLSGKPCTRTISLSAIKYYLENIQRDYGHEYFHKAVISIYEQAIKYKTYGKGNLKSQLELAESLLKKNVLTTAST